MSENKPDVKELEKDLNVIAGEGIRADRQRLKEDMVSQFSDPDEFIREYAVNANDAGAKHCWISGKEDEATVTIIVKDDGHGMDRQGVIDFNTIYRSVKKGDMSRIVGQHGIGKLSVAAIPEQISFEMITSTGNECWKMTAGRLIDETPIKLERIEPVPSQGTEFRITFKKRKSLGEELKKLGNVLEKYVRFLPMTIIVIECEGQAPEVREVPRHIQGLWLGDIESFNRQYRFTTGGCRYEAVLGIGASSHEIYQNRVLVSDRYNLISHDISTKFTVPHIRIRVDSPDFELPFGRHALRNEDVLGSLSHYLRKNVLPKYFAELSTCYLSEFVRDYAVSPAEIEDIAVSLMKFDSGLHHNWSRLPVFHTKNRYRLSLEELSESVCEKKKLYLEGKDIKGIDYMTFDATVLSCEQPAGGLDFVKKYFGQELLNLGLSDVVLEAPQGSAAALGPREKKFERFLGFHPEALKKKYRSSRSSSSSSSGGGWSVRSHGPDEDEIEQIAGVCEESLTAQSDLKDLKWKVNYLVERDGSTPNVTHRFLHNGDRVTLNLNHPEIQELLKLSDSAPALSGHWALAMCLTDGTKILPHLTPEAREDLILIDGMGKCGMAEEEEDLSGEKEKSIALKRAAGSLRSEEDERNRRDFLYDSNDYSLE